MQQFTNLQHIDYLEKFQLKEEDGQYVESLFEKQEIKVINLLNLIFKYGVHPTQRLLDRSNKKTFNLEKRIKKINLAMKMIELREEGYSLTDIAKKLDLSFATTQRFFSEKNLQKNEKLKEYYANLKKYKMDYGVSCSKKAEEYLINSLNEDTFSKMMTEFKYLLEGTEPEKKQQIFIYVVNKNNKYLIPLTAVYGIEMDKEKISFEVLYENKQRIIEVSIKNLFPVNKMNCIKYIFNY